MIVVTFVRNRRSLFLAALGIVATIIIVLALVIPRFLQARAIHTFGGNAPNDGQWTTSNWAPSDNTILGTAQNNTSDVWFTGSNGTIGEVFYPTADVLNTTLLQFLIGDSSHSWVNQEKNDTIGRAHV